MRAIEYLHAPFQSSAAAAEDDELFGLVSISDALFETPTRIMLGAFPKAMTEETAPIEVWWRFKSPERIGLLAMLQETLEEGLLLRSKIVWTRRGQDALVLLRAGVVEELCISFAPLTWEMVQQSDGYNVRHISALEVQEVDFGTFDLDTHVRSRVSSLPPPGPIQYQIISGEAVPAATRAIAEAALRCVSQELELRELPPLRWIRPMESCIVDPEETFWSRAPCRGLVRLSNGRPVIHLRSELHTVKQIVEVVAHECLHVAQVLRYGMWVSDELEARMEAEATQFGREFPWAHPEFISSVLPREVSYSWP